MESLKQFIASLTKSIDQAIDEGDVYRANEIAGNMLLGLVILIMELLTILCEVLNEVGIFTADLIRMRGSVIAVLIIETPIIILNSKSHGTAKYIKGALCWGLLAVCTILSSTLGHNVSFIMVIPIVLTLRYCDVKLTRIVAFFTIVLIFLAALGNSFFGIINLNVYQVSSPITITIQDKIRNALDLSNMDNLKYFKDSIINDVIPKLLVYSVIGFSATQIAERGKDLTVFQDKITKKTQRLETELSLATEIQASMLPCIFPAFPDHGELELFAINYPAKEVGGDFYDYFVIDESHIAIVMADVSGKGVGAALFMTIAKIVLKNQLMATLDPAKALNNTNKQLCENNEAGLFVTCWTAIYEIPTHTLTYSNAGHNPPILMRKDNKVEYLLDKPGFVLAGYESSKYVNHSLTLSEGDEIFLYTDGVTECNDKNENLYGETRLLEKVETNRNYTSADQINNIIADLQEYMNGAEQFDDITMLAMKIKEKN